MGKEAGLDDKRFQTRSRRSSRRCIAFVAMLVATASALLLPFEAHGFAFLGDRRMANPQPAIGGAFLPAPVYWTNATLTDPPAPGLFAERTLNITFNTAEKYFVPVADRSALQNAITTWQNRNPVASDNLVLNPNGFPAGTPVKSHDGRDYDLESILLHELGHAFGLDHPNLAERGDASIARATASTKGANGVYDLRTVDGIPGNFNDDRGDDLSVQLVDQDNNPFNGSGGPIDKGVFFLDGPFATGGYAQTPTRVVAGAGMMATGFAAISNLEAVMVQGAIPLEAQRQLSFDEAYGLYYLESGVDQLSRPGTPATLRDNYVFKFVFNAAGVENTGKPLPAGTQILINNAHAAGPEVGKTVFQRPLADVIVEYELDALTGAILAQTDIWLDGPLDSLGSQIQFVDITYFDILGPVVSPVTEPGTLALAAIGTLGMLSVRRRKSGGKPHKNSFL